MNPGDPTLASDAERNEIITRLQTAHEEGRLDDAEMTERVEAALRARTRGDLSVLLADLPAGGSQITPVPQPGPPAKRSRRSMAKEWSAWGVASSVTFVVWLITAVTAGSFIYPWFLWVAGPWGAVLLVKTISNRYTDDD